MGTDFNWDYHVSFKPEDMAKKQLYYNYKMQSFPVAEGPRISVVYKNESGTVFHTYSSFGRGLGMFIGAYHLLDIVPKGRMHARVRCRLGRPGTRRGPAPHYRDNLNEALALHLFHARS